MPYVTRNKSGEVIDLQPSRQNSEDEWIDADSPEIITFLKSTNPHSKVKHALSVSDYEMLRVVEDLIDLLIEKQVFVYTELPTAVQEKLHSRKQLRKNMQSLSNLVPEDDTVFPDD